MTDLQTVVVGAGVVGLAVARQLAEAGHFPAIDIEHSVSRAMNDIITPEHKQDIRRFRQVWSTYQQNKDLIAIGAYQRGSDARIDEAIRLQPSMAKFLQQDTHEAVSYVQAGQRLRQVMAGEEVV